MEDNGISDDNIYDFFVYDTYNKNMSCFFKCLLMEEGVYNENGTFNNNIFQDGKTIEGISPSKIDKFLQCVSKVTKIKECNDVKPIVGCFKMFYNTYNTYMKKLPKD